jgi:2-dehydro-3-deoxyphosphogluconate aldolase / (4S)-4-hydroxy-2-oxoglutarate aldolase
MFDLSFVKRILPVVTFYTEDDVLPVAETFLKAGLPVMEIPLRTNIAEKAISSIRKNFPEIYIGAGTLLSETLMQRAIDAGAQFGLSPSLNQTVCNKAAAKNFPFIPGVMTPSEVELACELGFTIQKLFPAQLLGVPYLQALLGPYEQLPVKFIPMGGVNIKNMNTYLEMKNVIAVGGSWLAPQELMLAKNYKEIGENINIALKSIH